MVFQLINNKGQIESTHLTLVEAMKRNDEHLGLNSLRSVIPHSGYLIVGDMVVKNSYFTEVRRSAIVPTEHISKDNSYIHVLKL